MTTCTECGAAADGAYCAQCGAPVQHARCRECGSELPAGARFCTSCGVAVRARSATTPFLYAGLVLLLLAVPFAYWVGAERAGGAPAVASDGLSMTPAGTGGSMGQGFPAAAGSPPPLTGTRREQADRLFERVMRARATDNVQEADFFTPMAIRAYQSLDTMDADARFHVALLQISSGAIDKGRAAADRILAERPTHLLALGAAATGALMAGDSAAARAHFQRYLDAYESEVAAGLDEYDVHGSALADYRRGAQELLGQ